MDNSHDFANLRVAAFESRQAEEMERMLLRHGGQAFVSPSMREVQKIECPQALDFANRLLTGEVTVVIFLTGVGFRHLLEVVGRNVDRQRFLDTLSDITTVARGPKPAAAMRDVGLTPTHRVPEPNTWRELLATIDANVRVANQLVGLQEYGKRNASLIAGLEARGAEVLRIPIYRWELPEDIEPLTENLRAICAGERDVAMFTSAVQWTHLLQLAEAKGCQHELRDQLQRMVVASIGPTTSETLQEDGLQVDLEPPHPKMGSLVKTAAERSPQLLQNKQRKPVMISDPQHSADDSAPWYNSPFMKACRHEPTDVTPVWLMRQAGRYMAEYREVRAQTTFLDLCKNPQLCSEVMVTAVEKLGVDAAIIFSDLLPILEPMGLDLEFAKGEGPVIHNPVRSLQDVDRVRELESMEPLNYVAETVRQTREDLPADMPLIGFAGAPFTLASYAIEGGGSKAYLHTKSLMFSDQGAWRALMERFERAITLYLNAQIEAGAQCVQLFDSWVGCLSPNDYRQFVLPHLKNIINGITPGVPVINFATGNPQLLPLLAEAGGDVIGVDWRIGLEQAWEMIGHDRSVQGNLEPAVLLGSQSELKRRVAEVLDQAAGRPGHIFNLGHGVLQNTPVENAQALVKMVHELSADR